MGSLVRASGIRGAAEILTQLGLDAPEMLRRFGLPLVVTDDEQQVSVDAYAALLEEAVERSGRRDIGLMVATAQDIHVLGPLAIAMQNCATVGEAMRTCSRYLHMQSPALVMDVVDDNPWSPEHIEMRFEFHGRTPRPMPQVYEQCIADLTTMIRFLSGGRGGIFQVNLPHDQQGSLSAYRAVFGPARIVSNAESGGLVVSRDVMNIPLGGLNETLKQMSVRYLQMAYDSPSRTVADQVRHVIRRALGTSQATKQAVAELLFMHPRTLQRRLSAEATSFEQLRTEEQKSRVLRYLRQTNVPLSQIALVAGLSEQSALTRACRQWFGETPSAIRAKARPPSAGTSAGEALTAPDPVAAY